MLIDFCFKPLILEPGAFGLFFNRLDDLWQQP